MKNKCTSLHRVNIIVAYFCSNQSIMTWYKSLEHIFIQLSNEVYHTQIELLVYKVKAKINGHCFFFLCTVLYFEQNHSVFSVSAFCAFSRNTFL